MRSMKKTLPAIALRGLTVLPGMIIHFDIDRDKSITAVEKAMVKDQTVYLVMQLEAATVDPVQQDLCHVGTIAQIKQVLKLPSGVVRVLVEAKQRAELLKIAETEGCLIADVKTYKSSNEPLDTAENAAMLQTLKDLMGEYISFNPRIGKTIERQFTEAQEMGELVDYIAVNLPMNVQNRQKLLETIDEKERCQELILVLMNDLQIMNIRKEIQEQIKERVDKNQKEYLLREQLQLIREELGEDKSVSDADSFDEALRKLKAPVEVKEKLAKEIARFKQISSSSSESAVSRGYIETLLDMPWNKASKDNKDLKNAEQILNEDHYGLEKVKERMLEFLAVRNLTAKGNSPIICLIGPPGTGKTSIAKSVARALGKKYVRISLGGVRDEAEIRGHRKTYVGAMPGRIATGLKHAGVKNPLILLDEIDKISKDYKGDTASALLEVLDSEQNSKFRDHYLEVPIDLSEVLFIATANSAADIPRPLLDRMEIIEVTSYTENEKVHIAKEHLIKKQMEKNGIKQGQLTIQDAAIEKIARNYTKEAGVRQLERKIGEICRKSAREIWQNHKKCVRVTEANLEKYLGTERYRYDMANETDEIGIVRGLAWTSVGGDTLQIEVNIMPGKGEVTLTGQLGDVMKESAQTGISYIRSISTAHKIASDYFKKHDFHIHIPQGSVPKDGPSAGITMATALFSAITEKPVKAEVAMTGEITLRGRVLPIGGLKEKILAAKNANIKTVLVPKKNERDIEEIADEIKQGLRIVFVETMDEVLKEAL
ncbi:MAG TPA: endopeptidase La [Lachnospiraceae bacterium]|nr:endopeptidase La [Lachnospiraceae bacterium]